MISLGVDIGGTGCKCVAFSELGEQLSVCYEEYQVPAGTVNLPPDTLWQSVRQVLCGCIRALQTPQGIAVVTVSSFGESFVAVDAQGEPVDDIRMYFGNSESAAFSALVERVGKERFMRICKIYPDASYSLAKMLYTLQIAERPVDKFLFIAGYICRQLCGISATDISLACRSLLYDVPEGCWSAELLTAAGIEELQLPPVVEPGTVLGTVLPEKAAELGLPVGTKVVIGTHDQIVNALGAGVERIGDAVDTSGTCECITPLFQNIPEQLSYTEHNFACVPYLRHTGYVTYAYNISAGSVIKWYRDTFAASLRQEGMSVYDALNRSAPREPTGLMVLPFLQGMGGTPEVDPHATGWIVGLTTQTGLSDIYKAILEGITFEMRYNQEMLSGHGVTFERLLACGGGARSQVWLQMKADILGCEIIPVLTEETGAMGSAILGLAAVSGEDVFALARRFCRWGTPIAPRPAHQAIYEQRYALYKKLRAFYKESLA